jgi:hypothetical protein
MTNQQPSKIPNLTTKQIAYCTLRAKGENKARSYLLAGYKAANSEQAGSAACKLEADDRVHSYISTLKESSFLKEALTLAEKRAFLARAVRCDVSNPDADLIQEVSESSNEHGVSRRVKVVDRLRALELDSKIAGDFYSDREPQANNPFTLIIAMGRDSEQFRMGNGNTIPAGSLIRSDITDSLPDKPVIDAEIIPS